MELENSLRAIDRRIEALPYWDFARDVAPLNANYTSIFSDNYFGSFVGKGPNYTVLDGAFGKWYISTDNTGHGPVKWKNPYGFLRHPLSINKSPYMTRKGGAICGYSIGLGDPNMWNMCLNVGGSISDWTACVDSNIHGPAHSSIAGSWRSETQKYDSPYCAQWYGYISPPPTSVLQSTNSNSRYPYGTFINPYARDCFECPTCTMDQEAANCMCVPKDPKGMCGPLWTNLVSTNETASSLRKGTNVIAGNMVTLASPEVIQHLGDMGDPASSPNDPM